MAQLSFHGAANTVTGSKYLLAAPDARVLVDCGLFQGLKELRQLNWASPGFVPQQIDAVLLTHAHLDHTGYLPLLVRHGFAGPIYATPPTAELSRILLLDSAKIQEEDAAYANRKGFSKHAPALPLYETSDVHRTLKQFRPVAQSAWHEAAASVRFRFHDTGHLLGASMIETEIDRPGRPIRVLFSGDVGRYNAPLYHDPSPPPECDFLICESTYGDRDHPEVDMLAELQSVVQQAVRRGGVMLVAAFAVGRAQQLIYLLGLLMDASRIPTIPVFLDSPMASNANDVYHERRAHHDLSEGLASQRDVLFDGGHVTLVRSTAHSKQLNAIGGPAIIISSSGMMTGGRILHHLRQRLPDARNTVVLAGFQAAGTRGRSLQNGATALRMHGRDVPVRAAITNIPGLSGHADRGELLRWLGDLPPPRRTFLTHGEPAAANALADTLRGERGWDVVVPKLGDTFDLEN